MPQISYIRYKDILQARRIDAEFFKPEYLEIERIITSNIFKNLEEITNKIDVGFVGSMTKEYCENGILLLQTKNIEEFSINLSQTTFINERFHKILKKSTIKYGDILIARSGSFGKASIYMENEVCNSSDIIIVEGNNNYINNFYLVAFLNSSYGVGQLMKFASGGLQGHVNLTILESLKIPILPQSFQLKIEEIVKSAHQKQTDSKQLYKEAEEILLNELGLLNYQTKHSLWFSTTKKEIDQAKRYDSEYYQPKYAEIIKKIEEYEGGWDYLKNLFKLINGKTPEVYFEEENEVQILKTKQIRNESLLYEGVAYSKKEYVANLLKENDILFASMGVGSLGRTGIFYKSETNKPTSVDSTIKILRDSKSILPEVLQTFFNSIVGQEIIYRYIVGSTGIISIKNDFILNLKIPLIKPEVQAHIADKIKESHKLRKESKELLETAKRAVEIAIEENEETAMEYINSHTV